MEISASHIYIKMSPRKVRLIADAVRNMKATVALEQLQMLQKDAARPVGAILKSAIANAVNNQKAQAESLTIKTIIVNEGPSMKRWRPVSRGRAHPFKKRMSHVQIVLTDGVKKEVKVAKKEEKTKEVKGETK